MWSLVLFSPYLSFITHLSSSQDSPQGQKYQKWNSESKARAEDVFQGWDKFLSAFHSISPFLPPTNWPRPNILKKALHSKSTARIFVGSAKWSNLTFPSILFNAPLLGSQESPQCHLPPGGMTERLIEHVRLIIHQYLYIAICNEHKVACSMNFIITKVANLVC